MSTGLIFDGVAGSEAIDSTGESLSVEGADCSSWETGDLLFNFEHAPGDQSAGTLVGKVIHLKKIYKESDCVNDRQRMYFDKLNKIPYIYVIGRLWDAAGHENAKYIAAIMRDHAANDERQVCRMSVEGNTLARKDNKLLESCIRRIAITVKPANKTANTGVLEDPGAPKGFKTSYVKDKDILDFEGSQKSETHSLFEHLGAAQDIECGELADDDLTKAMTGGVGGGAPGTLTGGAALQREDLGLHKKVVDAIHGYSGTFLNKDDFKTYLKNEMPDTSDEYLDHFTEVAEEYHLKRKNLKKAANPASWTDFVKLDSLDIQLRKAIDDMSVDQLLAQPEMPQIHRLSVMADNEFHPAGRFMTIGGNLHHLEDYHGLLGKLLTPGPMNAATVARIGAMRASPHLKLEDDPVPPEGAVQPEVPAQPTPQPIAQLQQLEPRRPSVFEYTRVGHDEPHTIEVRNGIHLMDGNQLTYSEVATIIANLKSGAGRIRYKNSMASDISKMAYLFADLFKGEEDVDPDAALQFIRAAVAAGHIPAHVERALTKHIMEDPMVAGIGNKYSAENFRAKNKPGVWLSMDGNDFRHVNTFGHDVGDQAIRATGGALRSAAEKVGGVKLFRNGGDEFVMHAPTQEHAAQFMRHAHSHIEQLPPINGTHKLSVSFGMGNDFPSADKALGLAKEQKINSTTGQRAYPIGQVPNLGHSLVAGHEGPLPIHNPTAAAIHHTIGAGAEARI